MSEKKMFSTKYMMAIVLGISMLNCQNPKANNPAPTEIEVAGQIPPKEHTSLNSLDYLGVYKGVLPCADCAGIETALELAENFTYTLVSKYKGKSGKPFESSGTFRWNKEGTTIILENLKGAPNQYKVGENSLMQLSMDGKPINGALSEKYILRKLSDAAAEKLPVPNQEQTPQEIIGVKWKLVEMNGKAVQSENETPLYIQLDAMNSFKGFAGCNSISGHYETRENRIRFMRIVGTMKGCAQLQREEQFKVVIQSANNFVRNGNTLQFREGEVFLAKFEAMK